MKDLYSVLIHSVIINTDLAHTIIACFSRDKYVLFLFSLSSFCFVFVTFSGILTVGESTDREDNKKNNKSTALFPSDQSTRTTHDKFILLNNVCSEERNYCMVSTK